AARRRRMRLATVVLATAFALLGCDEGDSDTSVRCESDRDCTQGQHCGCDGRCTFPTRCATNGDCCGGRACLDGLCDTRFECRDASDCPTEQVCEACQCRHPACSDDGDCGLHVCVDGLCRAPESFPCDAACADNEVCLVERDVCVWRQNICPDVVCPEGQQLVLEGA